MEHEDHPVSNGIRKPKQTTSNYNQVRSPCTKIR